MQEHRKHAVVVGASMGGLTAPRVLADHIDKVTVLERDTLATGAEPRKAVPQGRHAHALLGGGVAAIAELYPGIIAELGAGNRPIDMIVYSP